jgi:hypothetical protein
VAGGTENQMAEYIIVTATTIALTFLLHCGNCGNFFSLITVIDTLANSFQTHFLSHLSQFASD